MITRESQDLAARLKATVPTEHLTEEGRLRIIERRLDLISQALANLLMRPDGRR